MKMVLMQGWIAALRSSLRFVLLPYGKQVVMAMNRLPARKGHG